MLLEEAFRGCVKHDPGLMPMEVGKYRFSETSERLLGEDVVRQKLLDDHESKFLTWSSSLKYLTMAWRFG